MATATPKKKVATPRKARAAATPKKGTQGKKETPAAKGKVTPGKVTPGTDSPYRINEPLALNRVREGRIKKVDTPRRKSDFNSSLLEEGSSRLDEDETVTQADRHEAMVRERKLFPANKSWAPDEEKLFELLFMRQYSPLMPPDWETDFRGIPLPDILFRTSEVHKPVVYSHLDWHFRATRTITRLIDLTAMVRAYVQTDIQKKIPSHIKGELDRCARWAAADGGYQHPHPLPNLLIEIVDPEVGGAGIIHHMQGRLKALAKKHRDFWRGKVEKPPVLYGLFIVNTTLLLLTVDAAKGPDADVSYQIECKFSKMNQGVWNAITVAIVVCRARDDLVARKKHFENMK